MKNDISRRTKTLAFGPSGIAIALGMAASAHAQPAAPSVTSPADSGEIVVTAQKREEKLRNVPISITVLSGKALDKSSAADAVDALRTVPGVAININNQGGTPQLSIRGVGAVNSLFSGSSPIGYYLDGVPFSFPKTPIIPDPNVFDLNQVEVLRGPQGTLYGVSALNGVVRVLTNDPNLDKFELKLRAGIAVPQGSSTIGYRGDVAVNVPIIKDVLAVRAVLGYQKIAGTINTPTRENVDDAKLQNYRAKVKAVPADNLTIGLSAWHSKSFYGAPTAENDEGLYPFLVASSQKSDFDAYSGHVAYDLDAFSIQSTTSYVKYDNSGYLRNLPLFTDLSLHSLSEEVLINSKGDGPLRWSLGGIYRDTHDRLYQDSPGQPTPINFYDTSKSYGIFGELTYVMFDGKLDLTGGARYFHDEVGSGENTRYFATLAAAAAGANRPLEANLEKYHAITPRAVATFHASPQAIFYASYSEGFRSGFDQYASVKVQYPGVADVNPDKLHNYEIGSKIDALNHKLSLDAAVYYIKWNNVQQTTSIPSFPGSQIFVSAPVNGSSASGVGADIGLTGRPMPGLSLNASFSVNTLSQDKNVLFGTTVLFAKGDRLTLSPKYTAGAGADYVFNLTDSGYKAHLSGSINYVSKMQIRAIVANILHIGDGDNLTTSRVSVGVEAPAHWSATVYVENLNNEGGKTSVTLPTTFPSPIDFPSARYRPRTFGLQADYNF